MYIHNYIDHYHHHPCRGGAAKQMVSGVLTEEGRSMHPGAVIKDNEERLASKCVYVYT